MMTARSMLRARREIILSAGSVGTPQLLMLSGIGDVSKLDALGIPTLVDLPEVGTALHDQPFLFNQWLVNDNDTYNNIVGNATLYAGTLAQYERNGTGLFVESSFLTNQLGFLRLPNDSSILASYGDPAAGPNAPHFEFAFINGYTSTVNPEPVTGNFVSGITILVSPTSRGSITLNSSSPFDASLIDPGFLTTKVDLETIVSAVQVLNRFFTAKTWEAYIIAPGERSPNYSDRGSIETYVRENAVTVYHPVATARIVDISTGQGVVNADLTVRGTRGLRIVDASVLPYVPAGHPQAAVYAIAERAVDIIKESW